MGAILTIAAGFDGSWSIPLLDADGQPTDYPEDATFDAAAWRGDDEAALFEPAVSWEDADEDVARLTIAAGQTATLDPGTYHVQVGITSGGVRSLAFDGFLEITPTPGTGEPPKTLATYDDMLRWYDQAGVLQGLDSDRTGFLEVRAEARDIIVAWLVDHSRPRGGFVLRRVSAWNYIYGYDRPDASLSPPSIDQLQEWLDADALLVDPALRKIASRLAVAIVLDRQETRGSNPYREEAGSIRDAAMAAIRRYRFRLDTSDPPDGVADIEIAPGPVVTFLGLEDDE